MNCQRSITRVKVTDDHNVFLMPAGGQRKHVPVLEEGYIV